ncbi:hypothetical protein CHS0354_026162 [Potamilus streckersoni]|uniref:c-SKI SMAD4-binding domain-containing protein n=1 Tax=Potamilus streckersoni TaxID=2493646 RepID=A0AAE0S239_9BIVA|nr:hypothetical protein CHS0354_026162 [Potamilus streckersoni]
MSQEISAHTPHKEDHFRTEEMSTKGIEECEVSSPVNKVEKASSDSLQSYHYRQNQVSTVLLQGVPIVCLFIDGKERLCLAQISNTLLKDFSYNEIHNRRVALGVTCVQCTPVQLEILRRAGAMPISSRRCGMITKREAERLVKSFLEDNAPPKLPENFSFDVYHKCGWGGRGKFEPSRYNSSRAKCIKCDSCNLYFSPNKFIFHFHRTPDGKYNHPDAANFNSWRRHLLLASGHDHDELAHAWEDVKAMFNGGSRKRMSGPVSKTISNGSDIKKPKMNNMETMSVSKPRYPNPFPSYSLFSVPGKSYPYAPISTPNHLGFNFIGKEANCMDNSKAMNFANSHWRAQSDIFIPSYDMLWANQFNMRSRAAYRPDLYAEPASNSFRSHNTGPISPSLSTNSSDEEEPLSPRQNSDGNVQGSFEDRSERLSAFRPVFKSGSTDDKNSEKEDENSDIDVLDGHGPQNILEENQDKDEPEINGHQDVEHGAPVSGLSADVAENDINDNTVEENPENRVSDPKNSYQDTTLKPAEKEDERDTIGTNFHLEKLAAMTKEDLQDQLKREMDMRQHIEADIRKMRETFHEEASKEKSYRDEMLQQLQIVKDSLCNELEQERKARFTLQQKLKEAHDALHNFSCKMFTTRQCEECTVKEANIPPR